MNEPFHQKSTDGRKRWCNAHQRWATHQYQPNGMSIWVYCCAPNQGGLMIPCSVVDLTDVAVIEKP